MKEINEIDALIIGNNISKNIIASNDVTDLVISLAIMNDSNEKELNEEEILLLQKQEEDNDMVKQYE